jgi:hypothetical protein
MLSGVVKQVRYARYLVNENSTTVLTGLGVAGVITTAYLTGITKSLQKNSRIF